MIVRPGAVWVACSRCNPRYGIAESYVDYRDATGRLWSLQMLDVSLSGVSFGLEADGPALGCGFEIEVVLRLNGAAVPGSFLVSQVTTSLSRGVVCGGEFHAASPEGAQIYAAVVGELELREQSSTIR